MLGHARERDAKQHAHAQVRVALSDHQIEIVQHTARLLPVDKRDVFLQRVNAVLKQRRSFNDGDVADAVELSLRGLVHAAVRLGVDT